MRRALQAKGTRFEHVPATPVLANVRHYVYRRPLGRRWQKAIRCPNHGLAQWRADPLAVRAEGQNRWGESRKSGGFSDSLSRSRESGRVSQYLDNELLGRNDP